MSIITQHFTPTIYKDISLILTPGLPGILVYGTRKRAGGLK